MVAVLKIRAIQLLHSETVMSDGRFWQHLFQAVFCECLILEDRCISGWSRVHKAVKTIVTQLPSSCENVGSSSMPLKMGHSINDVNSLMRKGYVTIPMSYS